jgi:hypothetical protein
MVLSAAGGYNAPITVTEAPKQDQVEVVRTKSQKEVAREIDGIMSTEKYVKQYFSDVPIMIQIARCESTYRHLDPDGNIHRGQVNSKDVGVMQINEYYHLDEAQKNDYDIYTLEGNTAYARRLYEKEGTRPWNSSKPCWGKYENKEIAINK